MNRSIRALRLGRIVAGLASFAAALWWSIGFVRVLWATRVLHDSEFGLRITPLTAAERAAALAREDEAAAVAEIRG